MQCAKCFAEIISHMRTCPVCETDVGFPNVRKALEDRELDALRQRYEVALHSASARGVAPILDDFRICAARSKPVLNRSLQALDNWLHGPIECYQTYYVQVHVLGRRVQTDWDLGREAAESTINPTYHRELTYAALTLDGLGTNYYGDYAVVLRDVIIEDRATVFDSNPFYFLERHNIIGGKLAPPGYRAPWSDRGRLAAAKLHGKLSPTTTPDQFPFILLGPDRADSACDFVEVHIYGSVNRKGIERISGPKPSDRKIAALWRRTMKTAEKLGIDVDVTG